MPAAQEMHTTHALAAVVWGWQGTATRSSKSKVVPKGFALAVSWNASRGTEVIVLAVVRGGDEIIDSFVDQLRTDFAEVATFTFVARTICESSDTRVVGHAEGMRRVSRGYSQRPDNAACNWQGVQSNNGVPGCDATGERDGHRLGGGVGPLGGPPTSRCSPRG